MKRFGWRWLAVSSVLAATLAAYAETRPQYGGTLHVAMRAAPMSLDLVDATATQPDSFAWRSVMSLVFETLVATDNDGRPHAALALSWQALPGNQRWKFRLRNGVRFHDGTALTPEIVVAALHAANSPWSITTEGDSIVIDCGSGDPELPAELALPRNAMVKRNSDGRPVGTGAFQVSEWQPGKKLTLAANESYWQGRPFVDGIEIELGRSFRDQMTALELSKEDIVEIAPEQANRVVLEGRRIASSAPVELLALVFTRDAQTPEEKLLRQALALSVDRGSMRSVLLQGAGSLTGSILPNWMSGYGFVFSADPDLAAARHAREQAHTASKWTIGYDGADLVARLLAERIALNAKDAGLLLQPVSATATDIHLMRIPMVSADPWLALVHVAAIAAQPAPNKIGGSAEDLYIAERDLLATQRVIPLFHLPATYGISAAVKNRSVRPDGTLNLADLWLENGRP